MSGRSARALPLVVALLATTGCPNDPVAVRATPTTSTTATTTTTVLAPTAGDLYAAPPDVSAQGPGHVVRFQRVEQAPDPSGGVRWRVMYTSSDDAGHTIAVTGLVAVPGRGAPPWPVLAWAHATTGSADRCAPSLHPDEPVAADLLAADGFVIASTDYAGIGGPGLHPYLDGPGEARAVLDLVAAADELPGVRTDRRYAVWGHSQGGHAALFARELAAERLPDHTLVATVAIAPPADIATWMRSMLDHVHPRALPAMALAGIAATHPGLHLGDVLVPRATDTVERLVDTTCADELGHALADLGPQSVVATPPEATPPWSRYLADMEPAMQPGSGPLLLVHAADDPTVPAAGSATVKERACGRNEAVTRWLAPDGGHSRVIADGFAAMRRWTLDRFGGRPVDDGCGADDGPIPGP